MKLEGRLALAGALILLGGALGCGQAQTGRSKTTSPGSTAPVTTPPPVTTTAPTSTRTASSGSAPTISTISTNSGPVDGGVAVTITGKNFLAAGAGDTVVLFGVRGVAAQPASDTRIDVVTPAAPAPGMVSIRVVNALGAASLPNAFTFTPRSASLAFSPAVGHFELGLGGTKITLALRDFAPVGSMTNVTFGTTPAASIALVDSTTLVAEVPDGLSPGPITITVEESAGRVQAPGFLVQGALAYGDLTINELCPHPSGLDTNGDGGRSSSADEFVEIVNTTTHPVDLSYITIYDAKSIERHRFPNPTSLPAGGALVVFGGGTPEGFAPRHESGSAQAATSGDLSLNNTSDTIELRTLPGLASRGTTIFIVNYTNPPAGSSLVNPNDGTRILSNPATSADYVPHTQAPNAKGGVSPGRRVDGSKF